MAAAIDALKTKDESAGLVVVAVVAGPVASPETYRVLHEHVNEMICLFTPAYMHFVEVIDRLPGHLGAGKAGRRL